MLRSLLCAFVALAATPAFAIDPGVATGHYKGDGADIQVKHAIAISMENTEGILDSPKVLRVLLSQEEVVPAAIEGLVFTPAHAMARAGALHGLLIEFDPSKRDAMSVVVLARPENPQMSMATLSLSNTEGVWKRIEVNPTRAAGEFQPNDTFDLAFSFSTPVFTNPVVSDLKGPAVQQSPQVKALIARYEALGKGDMATVRALSTKEAADRLEALPPEVTKQARAMVPQLLKETRAAKRLVVRTHTAALLTADDGWASFTLENGTWKVAD